MEEGGGERIGWAGGLEGFSGRALLLTRVPRRGQKQESLKTENHTLWPFFLADARSLCPGGGGGGGAGG